MRTFSPQAEALLINRLNLIVVGTAKAGTTTLEYLIRDMGVVCVANRIPIFGVHTQKQSRIEALEQISRLPQESPICHIRADYTIDSSALSAIAATTNAKILMMCRDPAQRLWSHYWHEFKKGRAKTGKGFEVWLKSERGLRAFMLSRYGNALEMILNIFKKEDVHILLDKDLTEITLLNNLFGAVGLKELDSIPKNHHNVSRMPRNHVLVRLATSLINPFPEGRLKRNLESKRDRYLTKNQRAPLLPTHTRKILVNEFHDDIILFSRLSGRNVSRWLS